MRLDDIYRSLLSSVINSGRQVHCRGTDTLELCHHMFSIDMRDPIITLMSRKLNYNFMAAEALWILQGQQDLKSLPLEAMRQFSDDGITLSGAYGPRFLSQVRYVVDCLDGDTYSRQAVMTLWERNPRYSRDIPCTLSMQFMIRDGRLNCHVCMRSSDVWLGIPYDIFSFSMMTYYISLSLKNYVPVGNLTVFAGSRHLYVRDLDKINQVLSTRNDGDIADYSYHGHINPEDLLNDLCHAKNTDIGHRPINRPIAERMYHLICR